MKHCVSKIGRCAIIILGEQFSSFNEGVERISTYSIFRLNENFRADFAFGLSQPVEGLFPTWLPSLVIGLF